MEKLKEIIPIVKEELVLGLSLERIAFIKYYFRERGYNCESEDFEEQLLKDKNAKTK